MPANETIFARLSAFDAPAMIQILPQEASLGQMGDYPDDEVDLSQVMRSAHVLK